MFPGPLRQPHPTSVSDPVDPRAFASTASASLAALAALPAPSSEQERAPLQLDHRPLPTAQKTLPQLPSRRGCPGGEGATAAVGEEG